MLTTPVMFSTRLSTIACTLSMLSRLSPSIRPCIAEIWLLALRRLADILFSFTWEGPEQRGRKLFLCTEYKAGGLLKSPSSFIVLPANLNFRIETSLHDGWPSAKVAGRVNKLSRQSKKNTAVWLLPNTDSPTCLQCQEFSLVDWCQVGLYRSFNIWPVYIPAGYI